MSKLSVELHHLMMCEVELPDSLRYGDISIEQDEILLQASTDEVVYRWVRKPDVFNGYLTLKEMENPDVKSDRGYC